MAQILDVGIPKGLLTTRGDVLTRDASALVRLAKGNAGQILGWDANDLKALGGQFSCILDKNDSDQSINSGSEDIVTFTGTEIYDPAGMHSTSSNTGRITVPSGGAGRYFVCTYFRWTTAFVATQVTIEILQYNSSDTLLVACTPTYAGTATISDSTCGQLFNAAVGDYFVLRGYQNSGSAKSVNGTTTPTNATRFAALFQGEQ